MIVSMLSRPASTYGCSEDVQLRTDFFYLALHNREYQGRDGYQLHIIIFWVLLASSLHKFVFNKCTKNVGFYADFKSVEKVAKFSPKKKL